LVAAFRQEGEIDQHLRALFHFLVLGGGNVQHPRLSCLGLIEAGTSISPGGRDRPASEAFVRYENHPSAEMKLALQLGIGPGVIP
jgi:hypothetical protein